MELLYLTSCSQLLLKRKQIIRTYTIKGIKHFVYEDDSEIPNAGSVIENWRDGNKGDWVRADDGNVIQILRQNKMKPHRSNKRHARSYIGTCTGTFMVSDSVKMDTEKRHNIYSFGGNKTSSKQAFD